MTAIKAVNAIIEPIILAKRNGAVVKEVMPSMARLINF